MRRTATAAAILLAQTDHGFAEGNEAEPAVIADARLRTQEVDLAQGFRTEAAPIVARPFPTTQPVPDQDVDQGPEDDPIPADPSNDGENADDAPPARPRPKFDLFDGPSPNRAMRQNPVSPAADPVAPEAPRVDGTGALLDGSQAPGLFAATDDVRRTPAAPATEEKAGSLSTTGILSSAPIRPTRLEDAGSRLNQRALPLRSIFPTAADDPFGPIGMRLGSFLLYSAMEQSIGVSNNLEGAPNGSSGAFSDTALSARFVSGWSRHSAELEALANYRRNFAGEEPSQPDVVLNGTLRLDVDRLTTASFEGGFEYRREDDSDLDPLADAQERRDRFDYRAAGAVEHSFGRAFARVSLAAVRETISDDADSASSSDEDFDTYAGTVRAGYRLTPAFAPFAEAGLGRRVFDENELLGIERDSLIETLRGGFAFDFGEKLNGEIAAGYATNRPDEDALKAISAPTIDAKLNWSPQRGTDIAFTAATTFDPDPLGSSTATLYQGGIAARHRATARLALDAALTGGYRDSDLAADVERTWGVSLGFTYWLNRSVALTGLASHRDVDREGSAADYDVNSVKLGLRLQN